MKTLLLITAAVLFLSGCGITGAKRSQGQSSLSPAEQLLERQNQRN